MYPVVTRRVSVSLLALAAALLPVQAHADEGGDIIVTGAGLESPIGDAAYDIIGIDRARLTGSASGRIEDVLRDVAGLQQFRRSDSRGAHPTSQGVTLRGLGGNASSRALVILDGVPQSDPFGGWVSWPAFAPGRLERAQVTRGGGSGAAGPGALAGVIELFSAGPDTLGRVNAGIAYGSRDSLAADATVAARLGGGFVTLGADYARGDGYIPVTRDSRGPADRAAPYEQASVALRAVVPVGETTELQANMTGFTDRRERGLAFSDNGNDGADASMRLVGRGAWGWSALGYVQFRRFTSMTASVNAGRVTANPVLDQYNVPSTGLGARVELRPPLGEDIELRLGSDWRRVDGRTKEFYQFANGVPARMRDAGGQSDTLGGFAELSAVLGGGLTLTGGGRIDRWWITGGALEEGAIGTGIFTRTDYADRSGWEPTGRLGLAYAADDSLTLRGAIYRGWRLPTLNELYRPFRAGADATGANAALKPETLWGYEAGFDWRPAESGRISVTAFDNRLHDAIANVTVARGPGTFPGVGFVSAAGSYRHRRNLDRVRARGVEVDGALTLAGFRLSASYAYTHSRVRADGLAAALDGLRPAQTPAHMASATAGWERKDGLGAGLTLRYVSDQYENDLGTLMLGDALTLDARAAVPVMRGVLIEARAENLTGARVEATRSSDNVVERASPRTLWLGVRFSGL